MYKTSTKSLALMTLIISTMMVISSQNWMGLWMGLEVNMLSFIPLMEKKMSYNSSLAKMTYFFIQSMGSMIFLFMIICSPMLMINEMMTSNLTMNIITMSMIMKMGMAPMHTWFVSVMDKMSWNSCMILMTWQKIAPLFIMTNTCHNNNMISFTVILSALIGAIGGINQTSIKKIMAFSSVNHLSWMLLCLKYDNEMWMKYLIIYSLMIVLMTKMFDKMSINYINQMNMNLPNNTAKMSIMIMFMSLGGLPPFIGFLPKWIVISTLIEQNSLMIISILMMTSMITLFYYIRMMTPTIMMFSTMNKWNIKYNNLKTLNMLMFMMNLSLPITMIMNLI